MFTFVGVAIALLATLFAYFKWTYKYWERRNLQYLEPKIPYGNGTGPFKRTENAGFRFKRQYEELKSRGWKHGGLYSILNPIYLVADLDYIKNIMTKDFHYFTDRGIYYNEKNDPLSAHLFALGGPKWRHLRTKLSPTFTSGKMKQMFQTLVDCVPQLLQQIDKNVPVDIKEVLGCFTTDIIGSCAFGLECKTFEDENSPFREYGRKFFQVSNLKIAKFLFSDFFISVVEDTVKYREKHNLVRKDFMQLLIDLKNTEKEQMLTIEELAAQCFVFFIAGFETSSTTMTFALFELAKRPDLQQQVRDEIETVLAKHGNITYDAIQDLKFMDQVIDETLRMYPPVPVLTRKCVKDYKIPDQDVIIQKGTRVFIPVLGIHYDSDLYPNPSQFDPDRFSEEKKKSRHGYAHLPFGEGPRICIGMRFGLMQTKVGLTALLKNYKFSVNSKTQTPLKMKPNSFILAAEGDVWLNAQKV
ncbi:probable cytochrome P450 6a14 isoform X2 [Tribolium castaneum]|uniref:probable cytochrome P450 6a14 isoform X2 n=1 Tax=Tribolium castaneum TaxID=7070 RepID=UPI00077DDCA5|nr:PREDICTED: probable cytochrome P450 6a14 isoform X2 [Tribolium castaneum]|eukprot:XP_015840000.1 PREDICTED: probable cytochrome P450 6a14 isoform X2 [Tribolium castaneum]